MRRAAWYAVAALVATVVTILAVATPANAATAVEYGLIAALVTVPA